MGKLQKLLLSLKKLTVVADHEVEAADKATEAHAVVVEGHNEVAAAVEPTEAYAAENHRKLAKLLNMKSI
jgi:CTP:molybdopterin cytidylyltransferase MocA